MAFNNNTKLYQSNRANFSVVLLSAVDFVKAVFSSDDKAIKEAQSKLIIRLIAAIALF